MEKLDVFFVRFIDDWVILAPTRWKLRRAIRTVNAIQEISLRLFLIINGL